MPSPTRRCAKGTPTATPASARPLLQECWYLLLRSTARSIDQVCTELIDLAYTKSPGLIVGPAGAARTGADLAFDMLAETMPTAEPARRRRLEQRARPISSCLIR